MAEITYNKTALDIISALTTINQSVVFQHDEDDDSIVISKAADANKSIAYIFSAPKEVFDFESTEEDSECGFYNFNDFYTLFNVFNEPTLEQDGVDITVKENKSKIKFRLTDQELIKKTFNRVEFEDPEVSFMMDYELIKKIKDLASGNKVNADRVKFTVDGTELKYDLYNTKHHNTFDETIEIENDGDADFSIEIDMKIWNKIPNASYKVCMKEEGLLRLTMVRDDGIKVEIYTADMEDS